MRRTSTKEQLGLGVGIVAGFALSVCVQACDLNCARGEPPPHARFRDPATPYTYGFPLKWRAPFHADAESDGHLIVDVVDGTATVSYDTTAGEKVEVWALNDLDLAE